MYVCMYVLLYCIVLYCTVLYCIVLYCIVCIEMYRNVYLYLYIYIYMYIYIYIGVSLRDALFYKLGVPPNGWFIMDNSIKMDDLRVPLFQETPYISYM